MNNDEGPWGSDHSGPEVRPPRGNSHRKPGLPPFDFDTLLKRFQSFFRPGSSKENDPKKIILVGLAAAALLWFSTGIYKVQPNEQGVVMRFGRAVRVADAGLNYHLPYPIETVLIKDVTAVNRIDSGVIRGRDGNSDDQQSMLTGDENLIEVQFTVLWVIKDVEKYLFTAKSPHDTVQFAAESVVREIISQMPMTSVLTQGRSVINQKAQEALQQLMDQYGLGIHIQEFLMGRIDPPAAVIDAYRDVQRAKADQQRLINEAEKYRNSVVPVARGEAQEKIQKAYGYLQKTVAHAKGTASRFLAVLSEYEKAPDVIWRRLYTDMSRTLLEAAESKVIMDAAVSGSGKGGAVLPIFPLDQLKKPPQKKPTQKNETDTLTKEDNGHAH